MTEIIKKLINLLGEKKVKFSKDYLEKYGIDWYKEIKPDPTAIVFPYNENDLQEIVLFAEKEDQKLVISGCRTGLCGGATAANKEIVVSLEKMNDMNWIPKKNQVISMVGFLKYLGEKKLNLKKFAKIIKMKDRRKIAPPAPAHGLYLEKIIY